MLKLLIFFGLVLTGLSAPLNAKEIALRKLDETEQSLLESEVIDDAILTDRVKMIKAVDHSLSYIRTPTAQKKYPVAGISRDRMEKSLLRFRDLLNAATTIEQLRESVLSEFDFYQSQSAVLFTGYYEPVVRASSKPTKQFRFPLYQLPSNFAQWTKPHPPRRELETTDRLKGKELVWLEDQMQAFLVHVQGSARLKLPDGSTMTVGYAGKTDRPYTSIGGELVKDGKLTPETVTLPSVIGYFKQNPQELTTYLHRNQSFVFFKETQGSPATGSIGVPVTPDRSIATDKSLMPPGGLALISTDLPFLIAKSVKFRPVSRFVLDQDTGSAIKGAGRVDVFLGTGSGAEARAGLLKSPGRLYYLVLKENLD